MRRRRLLLRSGTLARERSSRSPWYRIAVQQHGSERSYHQLKALEDFNYHADGLWNGACERGQQVTESTETTSVSNPERI